MGIKKKIVHKNPWFSIEKHDIDNNGVYYFLRKKPTVFIVAESNEGKLAFIEEFRYPLKKNILQLPAGMIDSGDELDAAKRELFEETHIKAKDWKKLMELYVAPGHEDTKIIAYYAKDLAINNIVKLEKNVKAIKWFSRSEIKKLIKQGKIECGITLAVLLCYLMEFNYLKK